MQDLPGRLAFSVLLGGRCRRRYKIAAKAQRKPTLGKGSNMAVNVGLVGLGMVGTIHLTSMRQVEQVKVVAVCDARRERLEQNLSDISGNIETAGAECDLSGIRRYSDFAEMLADEQVQAVDICLPTYLHAEATIRAMEAGKDVLCEKPMALTGAEASRMADAARACGRRLMIAHCLRFWPEYVALKEAIDSRRFGSVLGATFTRVGAQPDWSADDWLADAGRSGSAALDLHIHDTDVAQWFFGPPTSVFSRGIADPGGGLRHVTTQYDFSDGPAVVAEGGFVVGKYPFRMTARVVFEDATMEFVYPREKTLAVYHADGSVAEPEVPRADAYAEEIRHFAECVSGKAEATRLPLTDAVRAVRIVEAEIESARTGRPVGIWPDGCA